MVLYAGAEKYDVDTNEIKGTFSKEVLQDIIGEIGERYYNDFDFSNLIEGVKEDLRTDLEEEIKLEILNELKKDLKGEAEQAIRDYMEETE